MSEFQYTQDDKKDVVTLLRGIANDLENNQPKFSYDDLRTLAAEMVRSILGNINVDLNDYTDDMEISVSYDKRLEIDAGYLDLDTIDDEIISEIHDISDELIQSFMDEI